MFKVIPEEATRLAALKRGEVDIVYSIRGELAEELQRTPGLTLKPVGLQGDVLALLSRPVGPEIAVARRAGAAGGQPRDRPQEHQRGADPRLFQAHRQRIVPDAFEFYWQPPAPVYDPAKAKQLLAEAGLPERLRRRRILLRLAPTPMSARRCSTTCRRSASAPSCGRSSGPPFSRDTPRRSSRTSSRAGSGAFGNAATRLEAYCRQGRHLCLWQLPRHRRAVPAAGGRAGPQEARGDPAQDAADGRRADDLRADLAAGLHQRRRAAGRRVGVRADPRLSPTPRPTRTSRSRAT